MWSSLNSLKKGFHDLDSDRVLGRIGLEHRRSTAVRVGSVFAFLGLGVLVGVGIGIMVAPRPGRELRNELRGKLERGIPRAQEMIHSAVEQVQAQVNSARPSAPHS